MKLVLAGYEFMLIGLSSVALAKLNDCLEKEWDAEQFTRLLIELYPKLNRSSSPKSLDMTILRYAVKHHTELREHADSRMALILHAPWSFLRAWIEGVACRRTRPNYPYQHNH